MNEVKNIYFLNEDSINRILRDNDYPQSFKGFNSAIKDIGDPFILSVYKSIASKWSSIEGEENSLWSKFKNIFHKASNTLETTNNLVNVADSKLNPDANGHSVTDKNDPDSAWSPQLVYWGIGGVVFILILLLLVFIINSKQIKI